MLGPVCGFQAAQRHGLSGGFRHVYYLTLRTCLSQGGRFTAAPISYGRESFWRGVEEALELMPHIKQELFKVCRVYGAAEGTSRQPRLQWISLKWGSSMAIPPRYSQGHA